MKSAARSLATEPTDPAAPSFGPLGSLVGFTVRCLHQHLGSGLPSVIGEVGLKPHQFTALSLIVDNPGISQRDLAQLLGIKPSNMVPLIDELESQGCVRRDIAGGNRRIYALMATDRGRDFRDRAVELVAAHEDRLLHFLSDDERAVLLALLPRIFAPRDAL